jgi:multiple sugar transport system permease protein
VASEKETAPHVAAVERLSLGEDPAIGAQPDVVPGRSRASRIRRVALYAVMVGIAVLFFVPFFWSVSTSLKTIPESVKGFDLLPNDPTLNAYREVWGQKNFARYTANSAFLATAVTLITLVLSTLGGYAFARLRFPGREVLFMLVLATLMIPDQLRLVPVFQILVDFPHTAWNPDFPSFHTNLIGTYRGYIFFGTSIALATNLFLMRQYFLTIPKDYEEAAKLDGAGYFKTYWRVMLPLAGPALAAVTILTFQGIWNDFFWQLTILQDESRYTLPVGISTFVQQYKTLWPQLMAASVIAIAPIAIIYVVFQRYFIAGVTTAGVKG